MSSNTATQKYVREYLLGRLKDESVLEQIEMRIFTDTGFADEFGVAEHDLIEQYLDGELTGDERKCFDEHFLLPAERREMLRLVEGLRDHSANQTSESAQSDGNGWNFMLTFRWLRFAAAAVIVGTAAIGVWRFAIYESETEKGLAQLRKAYEGQRLVESRITALPDYAPYVVTRGADAKLNDAAARDLAELYLLKAAQAANDARAHHALSLLNFTERKYDRTLQELEFALATAPRDPRILSDAGAIYLELARSAEGDKSGGKKYEYLDAALKNLDLAISIEPKMTEPRFNRALCFMALSIPERAREAWREYLAIDSDSKWADEARRHLEILTKDQPKEISAAELETQFIAAVNASDEVTAARLIGTNRELIRDKYLPQRLAASYSGASESRRNEMLRALQYAGEIEFKNTGDTFAKDIALFYSSQGREKHDVLSRAHVEIRDGYAKCLKQQFGDALDSFKSARDKFDAVGDEWNSALANYFVGYSLININRSGEGLGVLLRVQEHAQRRGYLWLDATVSHWIGGANQRLKRHTSALLNYNHALAVAEKIDDGYARQRNLIELARLTAFVGQKDTALNYLSKVLQGTQGNSQRQRYRNYSIGVEMLSRLKLFQVAKALSFESITLADSLEDQAWISESRTDAGSLMMELGELEEARKFIQIARTSAEQVLDDSTRRRLLARVAGKSGELEAKLGDFNRSAANYREAVSYYETAEMPFYPEDANTGLLAALSKLGQASEIEPQIQSALRVAESYISQIADPRERIEYFALRTNIFEMACDFEARRGNYETAYDYAESSNARALLNLLQPSEKPDFDRPLKVAEIRPMLPANVQLLQYTVLTDRVLIWVISRDKFVYRSVEVDSLELKNEVRLFVDAVAGLKSGKDLERGGWLYDKLISPVIAELDATKELAIIPHKYLFAVPFAALAPTNGSPLIKDFTIIFSPSASVHIRCGKIAGEKNQSGAESFLGFGDPKFDRDAFDELPYLPSAVDEVRSAGEGYKTRKIYTGENATRNTFFNTSDRADVIHFAGHYVVTPGDFSSSYMLFAEDGREPESCMLATRDLSNYRLVRTKLIVLAACQTGVETVYEGEGMIGLASMFLAAKVPLVVASNWKVDSRATSQMIARFHHLRTKSRLPSAQALRSAQIELIDDKSAAFTHPYYWASFAIFGGQAGF